MISHLVRTELGGWAAFDQAGELVAHTPLNLFEACRFFRVRRIMFGAYGIAGEQREAWEVRPLDSAQVAD